MKGKIHITIILIKNINLKSENNKKNSLTIILIINKITTKKKYKKMNKEIE